MKRILLLALLLLAGCAKFTSADGSIGAHRFTFEGHSYIFFEALYTTAPYGNILHDPDCPCYKLGPVRILHDTVVVYPQLSEWQTCQLAIAMTESHCNPDAVGKTQDGGLLQITPIYVKEANRLAGTNYTHEDTFDIAKSLEMFGIIQDHYNPGHSIDKAIHLHNPGGNAIGYARKVQDNILLIQRLEAARKAVVEQEL